MEELNATYQRARAAREHAYAPYSGFKVGAALKLSGSGMTFAGCNVENASYGASVCAERTALLSAVAQAGPDTVKGAVEHLVIVTGSDPPAVPCALCLQVLQEFCPPTLPIHLGDLSGIRRSLTLGDLLPEPFSSFTV
jgi:cytidine deaminase